MHAPARRGGGGRMKEKRCRTTSARSAHGSAIRPEKEVVVNVPVVLVGKPEGVTAGGILQQVTRTLPILVKPTDIPEKIEVEVSHLKITESLHIKDVKLPAGVKLKVRGDQTIAVV